MRKALDDWNSEVTHNGKKISNLRHADNTMLIASSEKELVELFQKIEQTSKEVSLQIDNNKIKVMKVDRQNNNKHN